MSEQILKVEIDPRDSDCILITLRHLPERSIFKKSQAARTALYKGHGNDWYCIPSFKPAPNRLVALLKSISYGHQYKHLRCHASFTTNTTKHH